MQSYAVWKNWAKSWALHYGYIRAGTTDRLCKEEVADKYGGYYSNEVSQ